KTDFSKARRFYQLIRTPLSTIAPLRLNGWPNLYQLFETGEFVAYSVFNPIADQMRWLEEQNPDYALAYAESLEHLAFAFEGRTFTGKLKSLQSISETLTQDMAHRINRVFPVPLHQNYGLNEMGLVATKCPEGGRYHVHSEGFHVELIREDGEPARVGERGRLVVSRLLSLGMPLFRYNTDDVAVATDQNCPCGRTLPCFGEVIGRYSRIAYLPEGTLGRVAILRNALGSCPDEYMSGLRKYQISQQQDLTFCLRVLCERELPDGFGQHIQSRWSAQDPDPPVLTIMRVADLSAGPSGKFQDFVSHFMP
ncbi:MAG: hypothetical protein O3A63_18740, partial [Proteobacteria bacterium]|nr:hypothetical protein [Pseudomonadota bacterium]